jgi:fructose-1,6-bisphosphatase/inositol monophosphatase family enzyme
MLDNELDLTIRLVREAGELAADAFRRTQDVGYKPDGSEVTATDLAIEDLIRSRLAESFPEDAVIGEERAPRDGSSGRRWVIDPLGGTADFVRRIPLFSVDVAMEDANGPALAVSGYPMSDLTMAAGRGLGTWLLTGKSRRRGQVDARDNLDGAVVCVHQLKVMPLDLLASLHRRCTLRDGVFSVVRLITGEAHALVFPGKLLGYDDLAGLPLLVEEAGGRVTDLRGGPVLSGDGSVLATNGVLHDALLELIDATGL